MQSQKDLLDALHARLTASARTALRDADGIRVAAGQSTVRLEHLLLALYDRKGGPVQRAFERAGMDRSRLMALLAKTHEGSLPPKYERSGVQVMPELSPETEAAVLEAGRLADDDPARPVGVTHLFQGVLSMRETLLVSSLDPYGLVQSAAAAEEEDDREPLRKGSSSDAVERVQRMLSDLGRFGGALDGVYGPDTERAVREFQQSQGLTSDGIVGPATRSALERALEAHRTPTQDVQSAPEPPPEATSKADPFDLAPEPADGVEPEAADAPEPEQAQEAVTGALSAEVAAVDPDRVTADATDHLGVENEAFAFARVAASRFITPPLSIGVFGEWGSGKTFFMEKMRGHVTRLQRSARDAASRGDSRAYHTDVVQIQFNAWHYMESNLWASLVDHIFRELDKWLRQAEKNERHVEALYKRLATSRMLQLEALEQLMRARKRRVDAEDQVTKARAELTRAESKRETVPLREYWSAVNAALGKGDGVGERMQAELQRAAESLGFAGLSESAKGLMDAVEQAGDQTRRGTLISRAIVSRFSHPWWVASLLVLLAALPVVAPPLLELVLEALLSSDLAGRISETAVAISAVLATAAGWVGTAATSGRGAADRLGAFQAKLDRALERGGGTEPDSVLRLDELVATRRKEVELAEATLESVTEELEAARADFGDTAAVRLNRFIRDKIVNGDYARHLGIIATVRKDFEHLAEIMTDADLEASAMSVYRGETDAFRAKLKSLEQLPEYALLTKEERAAIRALADPPLETPGTGDPAEAPSDDDLRFFQRIILYIDDLDRCPPKTVVEVLQACHLLLSFPLFVVVVAVDARWVSRALLEQYKGLLREVDGDARGEPVAAPAVREWARRDGGGSASPRDYLEKIFQIPYWVRHMHATASQDFARDLVGPVHDPVVSRDDDRRGPGQEERGAARPLEAGGAQRPKEPDLEQAGADPVGGGAEAPEAEVAPVGEVGTEPASGEREAASGQEGGTVETETGAPVDPNPDSLRLTSFERNLLADVAPFAGDSPRSIKRFVNVYRLLRTGLGQEDLGTLVGARGESRAYRAIIAQLAIVTGAPTLADEYFEELGPEDREDGVTPSVLARALLDSLGRADPAERLRLRGALGVLQAVDDTAAMMSEMRRRAGVVKRYSFSARPYL